MSDARWIEIDADVASALIHFGRAVEIFEAGGLEGDDLDAYKSRMALLQAMQAGHTSLEAALERILVLLGEEKPVLSATYHADLVRRVSSPIPGARPAVISGALARAVDETRRFRHVARKAYDGFEVPRAEPAVAAARVVRDALAEAIAGFRRALDG
ncbi:hypothetical protein [Salinarimonas rosea]|uniref:ribonuclease toxin HepT-like protein n=1 Tax=Salinarimonas rosea TaxID=552063 RepID=UPI00040D1402|nr:hypothetical protein [Salinarimonas rosea]